MSNASRGRNARFWIFFCISIAVGQVFTALYVHSRMQLEAAQMAQVAIERANNVSLVLTKLLYKTQILSASVVRNRGATDDFEQLAATIMDDPSVRNFILAPDGVVSQVYPLAGNEKVLGLDYFSEGAGNKEALLARETGSLVLGGPFELVQGGLALVGRYPIYLDDQTFWGIASVTLNYPEALLGAELEHLRPLGYAYEIWRVSPDTGERQIISNSSYDYRRDTRYVEYPMQILNAQWYFRLSPIRAWYQFPETWAFVAVSAVISLLIGLLTLHNYDLQRIKKDLEQLSFYDPLTGLLNRRGGFQALQQLDDALPFVLCFLDLNYFKAINDAFGHAAGDFVLCRFSELIQADLGEQKHVFARVGGDEFVLAWLDTQDADAVQARLTHLQETVFAAPVSWNNTPISIRFSAGTAVYPTEGATLDELLSVADRKMYACKSR